MSDATSSVALDDLKQRDQTQTTRGAKRSDTHQLFVNTCQNGVWRGVIENPAAAMQSFNDVGCRIRAEVVGILLRPGHFQRADEPGIVFPVALPQPCRPRDRQG